MTATWKIWNTFSPCNFQNKNDFPALSDTIISQMKWKIISLVWIIPEQFITRTVLFFKNSSAKSLLPCSFTLKDWDSCNALAPSSATCSELFHSGNWFWKWIWKTMGEVDLDFKWAASHFPHTISSAVAVVTTENPSLLPSHKGFSKTPTASSMLNLSRGSEDCLAFFFCRDLDYWQF